MVMWIKHLPALQIILPLFGALTSTLSFNKKIAEIIAIITITLCLILSIYGFRQNNEMTYTFGDWQAPCLVEKQNDENNNVLVSEERQSILQASLRASTYKSGNPSSIVIERHIDLSESHRDDVLCTRKLMPIGIEYKLDFLNFPLFIFVNAALLFLLIFCRNLIKTTILNFIAEGREHLFFSILLFAHMGYVGMLSTHDLFNLYVFIEISSLSAYVLMAQGGNPYSVQGAFDYLVIGSIGATLILIGIGFLMGLTGSLNMMEIKVRLKDLYNSRIVITASFFIILGTILKMAFFPLHFWMIRAYRSAPSIILIYLASISGIIGVCVFLRFVHFTLDYNIIKPSLEIILKPFALLTIIFCSYLAFKARDLKDIIVYSTAAQIGYVVFLLSIGGYNPLIFQFLILDGINKISLFLIQAKYDSGEIRRNNVEATFIIIALVCSAGLPLSGMFITKVNILEILATEYYWFDFIIISFASAFGLLYHYKMAKIILLNRNLKERASINLETIGLICLISAQVFMLSLPNYINKHKIWDNMYFPNFKSAIIN